jgi:general secretion pathway protein G
MQKVTLRNIKKGFTLVELLIVIIIIAVLAAIAIPKFSNSSMRSKESSLRANLKLVRNAIDLFRADTGAFPATMAGLTATTTSGLNPSSAAGCTIASTDWRGPYLQAVPVDPVSGNALTYGTTTADVGTVKSSMSGNSLDGSAYSTW